MFYVSQLRHLVGPELDISLFYVPPVRFSGYLTEFSSMLPPFLSLQLLSCGLRTNDAAAHERLRKPCAYVSWVERTLFLFSFIAVPLTQQPLSCARSHLFQ